MPRVVVWLGPKGVGKSFLGRLAEEHFGIRFLDVEAIFLGLPEDRRGGYDGYAQVEEAVGRAHRSGTSVSLELTGASPHTGRLLDHLCSRYGVDVVRVEAPLDLCLQRIQERDASRHLPVGEDIIRKVYEVATSSEFEADLHIHNQGLSEAELLTPLRILFQDSD